MKDKYIIVEIIPTTSKRETGKIVQIQALKLNNLELLERFDYRIENNLINNQDIINMISYDKSNFKYVKNEDILIKRFKKFIGNLPLLIIDNAYTIDYLKEFENKKESILKYLNIDYSDDIFDILIKKYNLRNTNHLVDLLYESLIVESNNN